MASRLVARVLYLLPLAGTVLFLPWAPDRPLPLIIPYLALTIYARMAAVVGRLGGTERALLFVEALPFLGYAAAFLSALGPGQALLASAEAGGIWAALLWLERLLIGSRGGFVPALVFMAAAAGAGMAARIAPAAAVLGLTALVLVGCGYAQARRSRI